MKGIDSTRLQRLVRRRSFRWTLAIALAVPVLVVAFPRLVPRAWTGLDRAEAPPVPLESIWRRFEVDHDVAATSIDEFVAWLDGEHGVEFLQAMDTNANWSIQRTADSVRIGTIVDELDPTSEPEWSLDVRRAPWAGIDATLAASDLACVLCHARIEGDSPVRVVCATPFEAGRDSMVHLDGTITVAPDQLDSPDLVGALDAASHESGVVECENGATGADAAAALAQGTFAATRIDGEIDGPVVLFGTEESPIRLNGDVVIDGDLVLSGNVVGDGGLRVFGNVFVPGDVIHRGTGSVRVLVRGSVLAGEIYRPRRGEVRPVTGGPDGSFSFLVESLARFNGSIRVRDVDSGRDPGAASRSGPASLFTLRPDRPAPVLAAGARATGDWRDPSVELALDMPLRTVGPSPRPGATTPWIDLGGWRDAVIPNLDGPLGHRDSGTRIDAMFVVNGTFVAVAAGIDSWRSTGAAIGSGLDTDPGSSGEGSGATPVAPGALVLRGALIATHASIHAPAGLVIIDDPDARAAVRLPAVRGLVARLRGPRSSTAIGAHRGRAVRGARVQRLSVDRSNAPDRLPRAVAQDPATSR